jgi:putative ATPase
MRDLGEAAFGRLAEVLNKAPTSNLRFRGKVWYGKVGFFVFGVESMDLFEERFEAEGGRSLPLAARMRPLCLDEIRGQDHILGDGKLLRRAIDADRLGSIILYGTPGCGKTSLAEVIARATKRRFVRSSGVLSNVAELRVLVKEARFRRSQDGVETILFVDEIHRFNKSQQDVLLPYVEDGSITLIGATTHNPMFFINSPLTSRSLVFELKPVSEDAIVEILRYAVESERGLGDLRVDADDDALAHIARMCEGDARRALNALEIAALTTPVGASGRILIDCQVAEDSVQKKAIIYDHDEDGHYDTISAFIKSIRGSDAQAAVYWLAKMLYAGEDPRFIARRLIILASEDVGNADPRGLTVAVAALKGVEFVGMPEARIILSQAVTYLATAPKSNAAYVAVDAALKDVELGRVLAVPEHLKNKHIKSVDESGESHQDYVYPHNYKGHHVEQEYVPTTTVYYEPSDCGYEVTIGKRMDAWGRVRAKVS